ncbi:MAG: DUF748 domain-containing protein [Thermodesulfobacteriota bacterium]|nr:DUF748 domain-containing protein [Thermodesulfobacteriota bacterium]
MENKESKQGLIQKIKNLNRIQKIVFWSAVTIILYTIVGFLVLPPVLKMVMEKKLPEALHRQALIQKIKINPYTLTATVEGFAIRKQDDSENFIAFDRLFVNLQIISIFKRALIIKSVALAGPKFNFSRNHDLTYSFFDLTARKTSDTPQQEPKKLFLFSIHNIEINDGAIKFQDLPKDKIHKIAELNMAIPNISNLSYHIENYVKPAFSATINNTKFSMGGMTKPFADTQETVMDINIKGLNIPEYLAYVPNPTKLTLKSAFLDINAGLSYLNQQDNTSKLSLTGIISIQDIDVTDDQGTSYIQLPHIAITMADSNLLEKEIRIANLTLKNPGLKFERLNNSDILPLSLMMPAETEQSPLEEKADDNGEIPFKLTIDEILLENGSVEFIDADAQPFATSLNPIDVKVVNFSTIPEKVAGFDVAVRTESEESISLNGNFGLTPLLVEGNADIKAIKLTKYIPYLKKILIPHPTDGKIDISTDYHYSSRDSATQTRLSNLAVTISDFVLEDETRTDKIISLPQLAIANTELDLEEKHLTINDFHSREADFFVLKDRNGRINLANMIRFPEKEDNHAAESEPSAESGIKKTRPWLVKLNQGKIEKYSLTMRDMGPATPAVTKIDDLDMTFSDISTAQNSTGGLSFGFQLNNTGEISGKGKFGITPLSTSLALDIKNLGLKPLQPYVDEQVNIIVTNGAVSVKGNLEFNQRKQEGVVIQFNGNSNLNDLAILDAVSGEDLLGWKNLGINGIRFSSQPQSLAIKDISLQDVSAKLIIGEDGTLNLTTLKRSASDVEEKPKEVEVAEDKPSGRIEIESVSIAGGRIDVLDRNITPAFAATLDELNGAVTGLSSQEETVAEVKLTGKLNHHAPLTIAGKIAPLKDELFADLTIDFHDIDLSPTSPYTGKHIGYKTDKGKLTLNLHYTINGKALDAQNLVFLDQFTLGDSVDSQDAVSLPIHLAISLLKNRKGEIHLNVPVQGRLDDPEFSVGGVIVQVIFGLIAKAATSPFALLGALIPDGEDLQHVTFEPGLSDISENASTKLEKMAKVLYDRPGLRMDIIGKIEPDQDREALIKMRFNKLIKLQKMRELSAAEPEKAPQIETIEITKEEYPCYLSRAYEVALQAEIETKGKNNETAWTLRQFPILKKFTSNRSVFGRLISKMSSKDKPLTPEELSQLEEMEKLLTAWVKVSNDDLRLLAIQRADNVLDFLLKKGPVEAERLFIIEPRVEPSEGTDEKVTGMQVEMVIK